MGGAALLLLFGYSSGGTPATGFGRIEYTVPKSQLEYTLPDSRIEYTLPKTPLEFTGREN